MISLFSTVIWNRAYDARKVTDSLSILGRTISGYRIVEKLGGSGMRVVYKAEDNTLRHFVALKFLPDDVARDAKMRGRGIRISSSY